jgi:hypothetical protein
MRVSPSERGVVFVEFLIVFMVFLTIVLGIAQLCLIYVGRAVTQRAANGATRAAVVVLDDDPRCYGGAPRSSAVGARQDAIEAAASMSLMALSPYEDTVHDAIGLGPEGRAAGYAYARAHSSVRVASGGLEDDVTVHVDFDFNCGVPLGRLVLCGADRQIRLSARATLPNQGADYDYSGPPSCAPGGP